MTIVLQIVNGAAEKLGVKSAESALEPGDFQVIVDEMNDMLTEWADIGLTPAFVEVLNSTDTVNVDRNAVSAIKSNLAIRIAPSFQRGVQRELAVAAAATLQALEASEIFIGEVALPDTLPSGSGNDCSNVFSNDRFFPQNKKVNF
ncbi:MAG: hypothetical protein JKX72_02610 [Robiginitomaculum sp.]|nr:hypothetical protein [Robiginitomaculum sp.]